MHRNLPRALGNVGANRGIFCRLSKRAGQIGFFKMKMIYLVESGDLALFSC